jgi:hypothetical protein
VSPRAFDSGERQRLHFTEHVDCPACSAEFPGDFFADESPEVEDVVEPPAGWQHCPACGHRFTASMTGWTWFTEAGG